VLYACLSFRTQFDNGDVLIIIHTRRLADHRSSIDVDAGVRVLNGWYVSHVGYAAVVQSAVVRKRKRTIRDNIYNELNFLSNM